MANVDRAFGLRFIGLWSGEAENVSVRRYRVYDSNAVYMGDPVERVTSGTALATPGLNQVDGTMFCKRAAGADTQTVLGVVIGIAYSPLNLAMNYVSAVNAALGTIDVYVCDDPNALYEIQSDVTGIAYTDMGKNCLMTVTAGSTITGISKCVATGAAANGSFPLLLMGFSKDPKNDITSAGYVKVIVRINNQQLVTAGDVAALGV
jgi:hypothetical protein